MLRCYSNHQSSRFIRSVTIFILITSSNLIRKLTKYTRRTVKEEDIQKEISTRANAYTYTHIRRSTYLQVRRVRGTTYNFYIESSCVFCLIEGGKFFIQCAAFASSALIYVLIWVIFFIMLKYRLEDRGSGTICC